MCTDWCNALLTVELLDGEFDALSITIQKDVLKNTFFYNISKGMYYDQRGKGE